ncbi:MAG: hypothetical protein HYZ75_00495 [Elusimicrobia bacterium]|nr:hypothetical protein [Elusimicrobiota bacterium]
MQGCRFLLAAAMFFAAGRALAEEPTATDRYWQELAGPGGDMNAIIGERLFGPATFGSRSAAEQAAIIVKAGGFLEEAGNTRKLEHAQWGEYQRLLTTDKDALRGLMQANPTLRQLIWDTARPNSDAATLRLLDAYAVAKEKKPSLTFKEFLESNNDNEFLVDVLMREDIKNKKEEPKTPAAPKMDVDGAAAKAAASADVLASVGFDGGQAYGKPGDRHVYKDKAGNVISLSVTTRRMADGSMEDVLHVVNLNNRAQPMGATYSLRTDVDKLQAGVPVSIGGVAFTLKMSPSGDDHAITMTGANGPLVNMKNPPEPPMGLSQLYAYRAAKVFNYGHVVEIGGEEYYVSPETYSQLEGPADAQKFVGYGQFSYWPKKDLDAVFAAKEGREEVDPQTFDFKKLDVSGSKFNNVRGIRPDMMATVIRREGAQDVAVPQAQMGQDGQGRYWKAVLKKGEYVVEPGEAPKPGTPGWPAPPEVPVDSRLGSFHPDAPEDWTKLQDRFGNWLVPVIPPAPRTLPARNLPGYALYTNKEGNEYFFQITFVANGVPWSSGASELFHKGPTPPGKRPKPGVPSVPLNFAPFESELAIHNNRLSHTVHSFDNGASGYVILTTPVKLEPKEYAVLGAPLIWGTRFQTHAAALAHYNDPQKTETGLEYEKDPTQAMQPGSMP